MVVTDMETGTATDTAAGTTGTTTTTTTPREPRPRQHLQSQVLTAHHRPPTTRRSTHSTTPRTPVQTLTQLTVATLRTCSTISSTWPQRKPSNSSKELRLVHRVRQHLHRPLHPTISLLRHLPHPMPHRLLHPQGLPRACLATTRYVLLSLHHVEVDNIDPYCRFPLHLGCEHPTSRCLGCDVTRVARLGALIAFQGSRAALKS